MRAFSWKYFTLTGDVDAYMLYKDANRMMDQREYEAEWDWEDEEESGARDNRADSV